MIWNYRTKSPITAIIRQIWNYFLCFISLSLIFFLSKFSDWMLSYRIACFKLDTSTNNWTSSVKKKKCVSCSKWSRIDIFNSQINSMARIQAKKNIESKTIDYNLQRITLNRFFVCAIASIIKLNAIAFKCCLSIWMCP